MFSVFVIKYNSFYINSETIKYLIEQIQHIYNDLRNNNEFDIVERYGNNAKYYTAILTILSSIVIFMGTQLWQNFINIILSANVSRPHHIQISTEYFLDQKVYFYLPLFHINVALAIGCIALVATGSMLLAYLQHACGMFKIASYRIERAIQIYITKNNLRNKILAYKGIIHAVDIHRKATTFSNHLISKFEISFMFLILVGVLGLSLNIFRIFQIVLIEYNTEELLINIIFAFICFLYMFLSNFVGQQIIDHNNHIFVTAYKVQWYNTPLSVQKLILFLLQRGNKSFGLHVGGLFIASLECFSTLFNASISYFTIMYSMR
ncbi:uncharacterized protein [Temnothorax longispinosus]